jgi:hypothetical protein
MARIPPSPKRTQHSELSQKIGSCHHHYCRLQNTDGRAHIPKLCSHSQIAHLTPADCKKLRHLPESNSVGGSLFPIRYTMSVHVSFAANIGTFILFPPGSSTAYCAGVAAPWRRVPAGRRERENSNPNTIVCIGNQTTLDPNPRKRPKKQFATAKRMESYKQDCKMVNTRFATL